MEEQSFLGNLGIFGGTFAPKKWLYCAGQVKAIADFNQLYSIIGTAYGGDGRSTFGLPDLRGRFVVGEGSGPSLTPRLRGQMGGAETNTISVDQMPAHTHQARVTASVTTQPEFDATSIVNATTALGTIDTPGVDTLLAVPRAGTDPVAIYADEPPDTTLRSNALTTTLTRTADTQIEVEVANQDSGAGGTVYNIPPFTVIAYFICTDGLFPSRN